MSKAPCHRICGTCPCATESVVARPIPKSKIAVVVDWASDVDVARGAFFSGKRGGAGELMRTVLEAFIDLDKVYFASALNCRPHPKKKAQQKNAMVCCRDRLLDELRRAGAEKVLCVGPIGYGALMRERTLPAITKIRGRWKEVAGMNILATLPPSWSIPQPEYFRDLYYDVQKFFTTDGKEPWPDVELWTPESPAEVDEAFQFLYEHPFVANDLETTGFSPISKEIISAGFGVLENETDGVVVVLDEDTLDRTETWFHIEEILNGEKDLVFHNAKFDLQHLKTGLESRGLTWKPSSVHCTMMLSYALDERPMGKYKAHGLEHLAAIRYDAPDYGIDVGAFLAMWATADDELKNELRRKLHTYMGLDVYYTARLFPDLWNECMKEDERLLDVYDRLLIPGSIALAQVEHHGILLDTEMYEKSLIEVRAKALILQSRIRKATGLPDFNPGSPKQVKEHVYDTLGLTVDKGLADAVAQISDISSRKEGIRSRGTYTDPSRLLSSPTAAPVLRMIARGHPEHSQLLIDICDWRNYTKNAGTYLQGLLSRVDEDGRIHATLNLHGTATARLSSTNPNLQNMPPASHTGIAIRSGFIAPEGYSLIDLDYKQLEVRVAAEMSHDPAMKELFDSGGDPHAETSKIIYGRENVSHYERMLGKILTFGLLYGRSPKSIATGPEAEDIVARGGKRWGPNEVTEFFDNLLSNWNVYAVWRQACREAPYRDGEIVFSIGRKRRSPFIPKHDGGHAGRQGINTPCQGTASDFCLYALIRLHDVLETYDAQVISTVHDSLLIECADDQLDEVVPLVIETAETDTLWSTSVPLKVDVKVSKKWGQEDDEEYGGTFVTDEEE